MKPLILSACILLGTLALTSASRKVTEHATEETNHCVHVTYSCGVAEDICNFTGNLKQLLAQVWASDKSICKDAESFPLM